MELVLALFCTNSLRKYSYRRNWLLAYASFGDSEKNQRRDSASEYYEHGISTYLTHMAMKNKRGVCSPLEHMQESDLSKGGVPSTNRKAFLVDNEALRAKAMSLRIQAHF